jgi:heavy metal efflux system protein
MLDRIIRFSIQNKLVIGMLTLALIAWGSYAVQQLPIDAVPDITNNQVQIITSAPSQSAQDIERLVTMPIEQSIATIPGIEEVRSFSRFGLSVVTVVFHDDIDVYKARQQVGERLIIAEREIPAGVGTPELAPVTTGLGEIYQYTIHPKPGFETKYDAMSLRTIQDWIVRRQLLGVQGVADVSSFGGLLKQYEIAIDPNKLKSMNISIADIFDALEKNNQNTGGSYIDKKPYAWYIRSEGLITGSSDIENIVVKNMSNGAPLLIHHIAEVKIGHATSYGALTFNDQGEAVGAVVMMLKGENSSAVINNIKDRMKQIEMNLPEGVMIEAFLDRGKLIDNSIGTVVTNLLEGALIVIFILVVFLGDFRAGIIVASVIPLSMLFAISLMHAFGVSGNLMSLGAIDFGLIVDGAVIIVEATLHHLVFKNRGKKLSQQEMNLEVYHSASKIRKSAAFGELIILIVYLPILALAGVEGKMFKPMAQTVSFAILGAFLLSITYVPMMSTLLLKKTISAKATFSDRIMHFFHSIYKPAINLCLRKPKITIAASLLLLLMSLFVFNGLGAEFLPSLDEGDFAVETRVMTGSSLSETVDAATKSSKLLLNRFPDEIKMVVGKIGSGEIPTDPMPIEACDLMIIMKDKEAWTKTKDKEELTSLMSEALSEIPGVAYGFQQPIQMRFNELMTGARQDVVIKVYGDNLNTLSRYASEIGKLAATIDGAEDIYVEEITGSKQILVRYKRDELARFGINIEDVNQAINAGFAGQEAGFVYEEEKRFSLVLRLEEESRKGIEDIRNLFIPTPNGNIIMVSQVADVDFDNEAPIQIQRDDTRRRISVGFNVRGRDVENVVKEIKSTIEEKVIFESGYFPTYGGTFKNLQEARGRLSIAVPISLLLIFVLLFLTFNSVKQSLLIYSAIPLSAIGGILALWMRGMPFSISAGIGFIALFGVAVLNGIVLMAEFNRLKKEDGIEDAEERIRLGTKTRLRPVVMTAAVASLGFLPMALSQGSGAEVQKPLATVVIGGLITATLLTLLVLPSIYLLSEKKSNNLNKTKSMKSIFILLLLGCLSVSVSAQTQAVSLDSALIIAQKNNKHLQASALRPAYYDYQRKAATELPKTEFNLMYGQYNGYYKKDNNLSITQAIPFPGTFVAKVSLAESQKQGAVFQMAADYNELNWQIKQVFYQLSFLQLLNKDLIEQDTIHSRLLRAMNLRYSSGDISQLEKTSTEMRLNEIRGRQNKNQMAIYGLQIQLQTLLGVSSPIVIDTSNALIRPFQLLSDTSLVSKNPQLQYLKQQIEIAEHEKKLMNQSALPEFRLGYFTQTLYNVPLDPQGINLASSSDRFQGIQVGIAIPIWFYPQMQESKAAQQEITIAKLEYENQENTWQGLYSMATNQYILSKNSLNYYTQKALPNAILIQSQSDLAYQKGDISYAQHVLNLEQAASIKENYFSSINNYNQSVIYLEYLTAKK